MEARDNRSLKSTGPPTGSRQEPQLDEAAGGDSGDLDGVADHVDGALLAFRSAGHRYSLFW